MVDLVNEAQNGIEATDVRTRLNELIALVNAEASEALEPVATGGGVGLTDVREKLNELITLVAAGYSGEAIVAAGFGGGAEETDIRAALAETIAAVNTLIEAGGAWPPEGAIAAADFVGGRYWREDIGDCTAADIFDGDLDAWYWEDATDQLLDIEPGIGLTTGPTLTSYALHGSLALNAATFALVMDDGFCAVGECVTTSDDPLENLDDGGALVTLVTNQNSNPNLQATFQDTAGVFDVEFGSNYDTVEHALITTKREEFTFGVNFDLATSTITGALDGEAADPFTRVFDYSPANVIIISATASSQGGTNAVTGTLRNIAFYPQQDQAALNALTA